MGIKYGFCSAVKSRRINLGRTTLVCGTQSFIYSTDLSGTITESSIGVMDLASLESTLCLSDETTGDCSSLAGSFLAQSASYNATVQDSPMQIGCCADHLIHQDGYLINSAAGGLATSREHTVSVNGQGEPWAVKSSDVISALTTAATTLSGISVDPPPSGSYVPTSVEATLPGDGWQQGSSSWTQFEGLGMSMVADGVLLLSPAQERSVSVNTTTGRVDGSISKNAYYTAGLDAIPCDPVRADEMVCTFAAALNSADILDHT